MRAFLIEVNLLIVFYNRFGASRFHSNEASKKKNQLNNKKTDNQNKSKGVNEGIKSIFNH